MKIPLFIHCEVNCTWPPRMTLLLSLFAWSILQILHFYGRRGVLGALVGMTLTQTLISDFLSVTVLILSQLMCPLASCQSHYCSTLYGPGMGPRTNIIINRINYWFIAVEYNLLLVGDDTVTLCTFKINLRSEC